MTDGTPADLNVPDSGHSRTQHPLAGYRFSPEELRILRECNSESFFQRSLPLGTAFGLAAYYGVKQGFLKGNVKYGAAPKVVVSVIVGYFLGKFSYQRKCAEKFMQLPDSKLGELLRQKKGGNFYNSLTPDERFNSSAAFPAFSYTDIGTGEDFQKEKSSSLDLDMDRPLQLEIEEPQRPYFDNPSIKLDTDLPLEQPKHAVTYEELRKKNREEHLKKSQSPPSKPLISDISIIPRSQEKEENDQISASKVKNRYGDVWS